MQRVGGKSGFGWGLVIASIALAGGALPACGNSEGTKTGTPSAGASSGGSAATAGVSSGGNLASAGNAASAGSAGNAASAGSAGGGNAAPTRPDPTTQVGACVLYTQRYCEKLAACQGTEPRNCLDSARECPDMFYSEGSTRTVESVVADRKSVV